MINNTIIIPVKNEPNIAPFLYRVHEVMIDVPGTYEILVVMGDRETLYPALPKLPNQRKLKSFGDGLERSILLGFSSARGERIVVSDGDGSHPPEAIPSLLRGLDKYEMTVGSRFLPDSKFEQSTFRKIVSWGYIQIARLSGSKMSDPMSGFFAVRRSILDKASFKPITWKPCLEIELKIEPKVLEIPIKFRKRVAGISKTTMKIGLKILWDLMRK